MSETTISVIVEGGKASAGPPLAPALAPMGVNIGELVADLNKQTAAFAGIKVPVKVIVDTGTKKWRFDIGSPATSEMIKKELGIEKGRTGGAEDPKIVGDISFDKIVEIAKAKQSSSLAKGVKAGACEVLGVCVSLGATVDSQDAKEVLVKVKAGEFDSKLVE